MAESKKSSSRSRSKSSSSSRKKGASSSGKKSAASSRKRSSSSSNNKSSSGSRSSASSSRSRSSQNGRSPREIVRGAAEQLQELIGRPVEAVLGIEKDGREWAVSVEVLELERVPNTTDVLGRYEVVLDREGEVVSAKRTRRYLRSQSGED